MADVSTCCGAPVRVGGDEDEGTRYYVCDGCGRPCDARPDDCRMPCDDDCEIGPVHCWNHHRPRHKADWHDPDVCDEDAADSAAAREARASIGAGEPVVPWEQVRAEAGA